jgi:hypothetical protein
VTAADPKKKWGSPFRCRLCGHRFVAGDFARWIYANFKESPFSGGNFFVCGDCWTGNDADALTRAAIDYRDSKITHWWLWDMLHAEQENARSY